MESIPIPGRYIFQFQPNTTAEIREAYFSKFLSASTTHKIRHIFSFSTFNGFSAETSDTYASSQMNNYLFRSVEQDQVVTIAQCRKQTDATWGLSRVSEREVLLDGDYDYDSEGAAVDSYIIDTGIQHNHPEFEGRAFFGANFVDTNNNDCNGHGTHCAGTVGSKTWGIAKKTTLFSVKVLNCGGSGSWEGVIRGIQWMVTHNQGRSRKAVANMSLGGLLYQACNDAVDAAVVAGVTILVAGANDNNDACKYSPASASRAVTVGATEVQERNGVQFDVRSSYSNYGTCLKVFAPGTQITSTWINNGIRTISGTSMATPHVCGVAALFFDKNPGATHQHFLDYIKEESNLNKIDFNCAVPACLASPNLLLYSNCA